jgi:hypothetical protein
LGDGEAIFIEVRRVLRRKLALERALFLLTLLLATEMQLRRTLLVDSPLDHLGPNLMMLLLNVVP